MVLSVKSLEDHQDDLWKCLEELEKRSDLGFFCYPVSIDEDRAKVRVMVERWCAHRKRSFREALIAYLEAEWEARLLFVRTL